MAALKVRSYRSFPKLLSPVHTSQESSSTDLTVPCTQEPQQTQLLSQHLLQLQVLAEISCEGAFVKVRKTLQGLGAEKFQPPSTPTLVALHHISKGGFVFHVPTEVKCSPCSLGGTAAAFTQPQLHRFPLLSQERLSGFVLLFQQLPANKSHQPAQTSAALSMGTGSHRVERQPAATKFPKNSL